MTPHGFAEGLIGLGAFGRREPADRIPQLIGIIRERLVLWMPEPQAIGVQFYTIPEVATLLRCSPRTVHAMIHDHRLPAIIIGKNRYRIPRQALWDFLHTPSPDEESTCDGI